MKSVSINLFFRCNARCVFCVVGLTGGGHSGKAMSIKQVKASLDGAALDGCTMVTFSGGEPTIYPSLFEAVEYAKRRGFSCIELKTNGIRLADRTFTRQLIAAGVNAFSIAIHGPSSAIHDQLTGAPGAFARAVTAARLVREHNQTLSLPTCIQAGNYYLLPETIRLLLSLEPQFCLPTFVEPSGSAAFRFDTVVPRYSEVKPFLLAAMQILATDSRRRWAIHGVPMCVIRGYEKYSYDLLRGSEVLAQDIGCDYFTYEKTHYRAKQEACRTCQLDDVCAGPWRRYAEARGWGEFVPIQDVTPRQVIPLGLLIWAAARHVRHAEPAAHAAVGRQDTSGQEDSYDSRQVGQITSTGTR